MCRIIPVVRDIRFVNQDFLLKKFNKEIDDYHNTGRSRSLINIATEIYVAALLLRYYLLDEDVMHYEPRLKNSNKRIDFKIRTASGIKWI